MKLASVISLISLSVLSACAPHAPGRANGDAGYETAIVDVGEIRDVIPAVGPLRAGSEVEVGAEVSGRVLEVHADFNDPVEAGALLARIDPAPFESALRQAGALLDVARADARGAAAELASAREELERLTRLAERGAGSEAERRDQIHVVERLAAAQQRADANVSLAEGRLEEAEIDLARTAIRAPVAGFVLDRRIEEGQAVNAVQSAPTLFVVATDLAEMIIEANVAEADIGRIDADMDVRFQVDAFDGREFSGVIEEIRRAPVRVGRFVSYAVIVRADPASGQLLPGMTASVEFIRSEAFEAVRMPVEALYFEPEDYVPDTPQEIIDRYEAEVGPLPDDPALRRATLFGMEMGRLAAEGRRRVFVLTEAGPQRREVRIGAEDDRFVEIVQEEGGLAPGDVVIIGERD